MKVQNYEQAEQRLVDMPGATRCKVRKLIGEADGAPSFSMRQFEVAPGGHTPRHQHPYEHEVYVISGRGAVMEGDEARPIAMGDVIFVAPGEEHQFRNTGDEPLRFLCLVPNTGA